MREIKITFKKTKILIISLSLNILRVSLFDLRQFIFSALFDIVLKIQKQGNINLSFHTNFKGKLMKMNDRQAFY